MAAAPNGRDLDPGTRVILGELRDLRREMRADRRADRERAEADRQRAEADRQEWREERQRADEKFDRKMDEFREDSLRREVVAQKAWQDVRSVGLAIVK